MNRPGWDSYFMEMASLVAKRTTCPRVKGGVGTVIVEPLTRAVVSTGYCGAPSGEPHCTEVGCLLKEIDGKDSCIRTLHAESNAIDQAGLDRLHSIALRCVALDGGVNEPNGADLYCTLIPCFDCAKRIVQAKIGRVVYGRWYHSRNTELTMRYLKDAGVEVIPHALPEML